MRGLGGSAPEPRQPIGVHPRAEDDVPRAHLARRAGEHDAALPDARDRSDLVAEEDLAAGAATSSANARATRP